MNKLPAIAAAGLLAGCVAQHNWAPGPQIAGHDFEQDRARCSITARHSGEGGFVFGPPVFVLGAVIGGAIGNANRTQTDFNDCMSAQGWRATD